MSGLTQALLDAQQKIPALQKNSINPHFGNSYISLDLLVEKVLPILNKCGLVLAQLPTSLTTDGDEPALKTMLIHAETGESLHSTMPLVLDKETPQGQGSAITYARRYALMAFLGLVADEDDDAEAATSRKPPRKSVNSNRSTGGLVAI